MVDRSGDPRPRRPGGQAVLHHRRHRVPGNGPGRAAPAQRPRQPGGPAHPPGPPGHPHAAGHQGDPQERLLRPPARGATATASTPRWPPGSSPVAGDVATDGLGLDDDGRQLAVRVRHRRPLGRRRQLRLPPRRRRRGQPARAVPGGGGRGRRPARRAADQGRTGPGPLHPGVDGLRGRHPPGRGQRGAARRQPVHRRRRLAHRGRRRPAPAGRHRRRVPPARPAGRVHQGGPERARRRRPPPAGRAGRAAARGLGQEADGRHRARPGPSPSAGPTPTPTPRPWASGPWSPSSATPSP